VSNFTTSGIIDAPTQIGERLIL